ncbi:MAG: cupin domain-containing protein [Blastocatellia bacterium]
MLKRRDFIVALLSITATLAVVTYARQETPVMGSSIFDWNTFEAKPSKVGYTRTVFRAPTATLDELECHITTLNPGQSPHEPHKHADEEIVIIKEGIVESLVNGQLKRVGPGSIIFQAANQLHSIRNVGDTPAVYHVFKWNSPGMLKKKDK